MEEALRQSEAQYRLIVNTAEEGIWILTAQGTTTFVNRKMAEMLGYTVQEMLGAPMTAFLAQDAQASSARQREQRAAGGTHFFDTDVQYRCKDGTPLWAIVSSRPIRDAQERETGMLTMVTDITARKRVEEALEHQALHDALTGLPNRTLLDDRLQQAIRVADRTRMALALLLMDLDGFKEVNDTQGHHVGDQLLQQVGQRVQTVLRAADTVARLGGDEFAALLPATPDAAGAIHTARKILAALEPPVLLDTLAFHVRMSIGIAVYPVHGADAATLLRHADVAMYVAKRGQTGAAVYVAAQDPGGIV